MYDWCLLGILETILARINEHSWGIIKLYTHVQQYNNIDANSNNNNMYIESTR
jgi:hypothetical protein